MDAVSKDSTKFFEKGNKAAGTRARKNLQELKKLAQELRVAIQDTKANMTTTPAEWLVGGTGEAAGEEEGAWKKEPRRKAQQRIIQKCVGRWWRRESGCVHAQFLTRRFLECALNSSTILGDVPLQGRRLPFP